MAEKSLSWQDHLCDSVRWWSSPVTFTLLVRLQSWIYIAFSFPALLSSAMDIIMWQNWLDIVFLLTGFDQQLDLTSNVHLVDASVNHGPISHFHLLLYSVCSARFSQVELHAYMYIDWPSNACYYEIKYIFLELYFLLSN